MLQFFVSAGSLLLVAWLGIGVEVSGIVPALVGALVLALANLIVRPILLVLTLPVNLLTLGLFTFVVNGFIFYLVAAVVPGFTVRTFWAAVLGALLTGIITHLALFLLRVV